MDPNPFEPITDNKNNAQFLVEGPSQAVLVVFVRWVGRGRCAILCARHGALFLDKDIRDEVVDHRGADGGVAPGPKDHSRRVDNLESVQHRE
jgi:hypothetical protein